MIKKTLAIGIAALSMAGVAFGLSVVPASAAPMMMGHDHPMSNNGQMMGDNGPMMGDHHHHWHRHQVCRTVWFHHHRHTICHWM